MSDISKISIQEITDEELAESDKVMEDTQEITDLETHKKTKLQYFKKFIKPYISLKTIRQVYVVDINDMDSIYSKLEKTIKALCIQINGKTTSKFLNKPDVEPIYCDLELAKIVEKYNHDEDRLEYILEFNERAFEIAEKYGSNVTHKDKYPGHRFNEFI